MIIFQLNSKDFNPATHTVSVDLRRSTTVHFKEVSQLITVVDSAFVSFEAHVMPLLEQLYEISLAANNSYKAASHNKELQAFQAESRYLAKEAQELYRMVTLTMAPFDAENLYEKSYRAQAIDRVPKTHEYSPGRKTKRSTTESQSVHRDSVVSEMILDELDLSKHKRETFDRYFTKSSRVLSRSQRQALVAAGIGAAVAAGGSWLLHATHLDTLLGLSQDSQEDKLAVDLGIIQDRIGHDETHLADLDEAVMSLFQVEKRISSIIHFENSLNTLARHFEGIREKATSYANGVADLLHARVTPSLIDYGKLKLGFDAVRSQAAANGLAPVINNPADLYTLPASYMFNPQSLVLFVAISVPLYEQAREMDLYHFLPFPTRVNNSKGLTHIVAMPDASFLGVSSLTKTYVEMSAGDLALCTRVGGIYACPQTGIQLGGSASCIVSLFRGDVKGIFKTCEHKLANKNYILQKDSQNFQLYLHEPQQLKISCDFSDSIHEKKFTGVLNVKLPFGCSGEVESFQFSSHKALMGQTIKLKLSDLPYADEVPHQFQSVIEALERHANDTLTHDEKLLGDSKYVIDLAHFRSNLSGVGTISVMAVVGLLILGALIYCFWRRGRRNFKRKIEARRRETDNIEMRAPLEINVNTAASPVSPPPQREVSTRSDSSAPPRYVYSELRESARALEPTEEPLVRAEKAYYTHDPKH